MQPGDHEQGPRPGDPDADRYWLRAAIALSVRCPPSATAFSVGAILVAGTGDVIATGFSREEDRRDHAEEVALRRAAAGDGPAGAGPAGSGPAGDGPAGSGPAGLARAGLTLYSSLEPCVRRASRPVTCAELTLAAGIRRVAIAWREPLFVPGGGAAWLSGRGVTVVEYPDLAAAARAANRHLTGG